MKKYYFLSFMLCIISYCKAENIQENPPLLRTGQLSNGLTYYIRHNPASEGHTSYYLVQNVGALLEEDDQNGLAHFLEHMAFNGSKHYPGKSMQRMLEKQGISLTHGINAYTSLNETLYGLDNVPNAPGMQDSCLLILHDWSHFLTLDSEAIEAERPVILEEWRTRRDAAFRMKAKTRPLVYQGSRYATRDIIGDTTVIKNFRPEAFRAFYHTWYRPDLQAILIIGDLNIEQTEQQIKKIFADIPAPVNAPERPFIEIPLKEEFTFVQATDPAAPHIRIIINTRQKTDTAPATTGTVLKEELETQLFNRLMRERLFEMFRKNNVPALGSSIMRYDLQRGYKAFALTVIPRAGDEEKVVKAILTEKERVKQYGFTQSELQRAGIMLLREAEAACAGQNKQPNSYYIEKYSRNFLENIPVAEPEEYLAFVRREIPGITSERLIRLLGKWDDGSNYAITVTGPEGMAQMNAGQFREWIESIPKMTLSPYEEEQTGQLLSSASLPGGKTVKENTLENFGAKEWTLSNGARVVFKPVTSEQHISLLAFREGGTSGLTREETVTANALPRLVGNYGIGQLDALQLDKVLSVKGVYCGINIRPAYEAIAGRAPASEAETLLQMIWLRFEQPRFDPNAHRGTINQFKSQLAQSGKNAFQQINDTLTATINNYHFRSLPLQKGELDKITPERAEQLYRKKFSNPASFTYIITGNGKEEEIRKLAEKYIGSFAPASPMPPAVKEEAVFPAWKTLTKTRTLGLPEQKSTILINLISELPYSVKNEYYNGLLSKLISARCIQELREKDGAVYNVTVQKEFEKLPAGKAILMVHFECAPGREQELATRVKNIFRELEEKGPQEEELQQAIKQVQAEEKLAGENSSYWTNTLFSWYLYGINTAGQKYRDQLYGSTGIRSCRSYFKDFMKKAHQTEFFFLPEPASR